MIKLDENFRLENDSNEWTLIFEQEGEINPKTGKPSKKSNKWHCGSLNNALKRYANEVPKPSMSVQELITVLERVNETINNLKF